MSILDSYPAISGDYVKIPTYDIPEDKRWKITLLPFSEENKKHMVQQLISIWFKQQGEPNEENILRGKEIRN